MPETIQINNTQSNISQTSSSSDSTSDTPSIEELIPLPETLSDEQKNSILTSLAPFKSIISHRDDDIGLMRSGLHHIELLDKCPVYLKARRFQGDLNEKIEEQIQELYLNDIIEPSKSPWNAPVVPVRKPDGTIRLCIDYRQLNRATKPDRFPMPNLTDSIYSLHGMKYFSSIDLVRGYYQLEMSEDSKEYTAFSTPRGHWQFRRMPFGLRNAPASFQRQMDSILKDFCKSNVLAYLDDVLIMSPTYEHHLELVKKVLTTFREHGIKIKAKKCTWFSNKIKFLGHEVGIDGIAKLPCHVEKIQNYPKPTNTRQLREFLGMIQFQRKFAKNISEVLKPLSAISGMKGKKIIRWTEEMDQSFVKAKEILAEEVRLSFPDYSGDAAPLCLYVDASGKGAGCCLQQMQNGEMKTITYDSTSFNPAEKNYATIERELAAIRWACKTLKAFLYGRRFNLYTDHEPLVYLWKMRLVD